MSSSAPLYGRTRRAWADLPRLHAVVYIGAESKRFKPTLDDPYEHDNVVLDLDTGGGKKSLFINLSAFTVEELEVFRTLINTACDAALPVCQSLDDVSRARMEAGDEELSPRLFRARPVLVVRNLTAKLAGTKSKKATPTTRSNEHDDAERSAYASERAPEV